MLLTDLGLWPLSGLTMLLIASVARYAVLYQLQHRKHHPQEPPIIPSSVPYIGHPLSMALKGGVYVKRLG